MPLVGQGGNHELGHDAGHSVLGGAIFSRESRVSFAGCRVGCDAGFTHRLQSALYL